MGTIKDKNGMDLTEVEDIKKRRQEYTEEIFRKDLNRSEQRSEKIWTESTEKIFMTQVIMMVWSLT